MQSIFRLIGALVILILTASPSMASVAITGDPPGDGGISSHLLISEIETATVSSASQEFVELYNPTPLDLAVSNWTLEYKSATSPDAPSSWAKKATLTGTVESYGFYLVASKNYLIQADAEWTPTLAASAGHVRLKDASGQVVDQLGYGASANAALGDAPPAPAVGESLERLPGRLDEAGGNATDTRNNGADFVLRAVPQPQSSVSLIEVPSDAADPVEDDDSESVPEVSGDDGTVVSPTTYPLIQVTELLVDPVSPLTDASDEFIELFNPGLTAVNLEGYVVRTGSNFHDYYVLPDSMIEAGGYQVLYSKQTGLGLTNSGGAVELLDPSGAVSFLTPAYGAALPGQAWASFNDSWSWTLQLSPAQPNVLALLPAASAPTAVKAKAAKTSAKAAAKPKAPTVKKAAKPKTKKVAAKKAVTSVVPAATTSNLQPSRWLLIGLIILTIGYALYEFRHDLHNLYFRARGDEQPRSGDRRTPKGRRGH